MASKRGPMGVETRQIGVYEVLTMKDPPFCLRPRYERFKSSLLVLIRLLCDAYRYAPGPATVAFAFCAWSSIESLISLTLESRILKMVEDGIIRGSVDPRGLLLLVMARLLFAIIGAITEIGRMSADSILCTRTQHYFDEHVLRARLKKGMPTLHETQPLNTNSKMVYYTLCEALRALETCSSAFGQIGFVVQFTRSGGYGPLFSLLCVVKPLLTLLHPNLWTTPRVVNANSEAYLRIRALLKMAENQFKIDVLSGHAENYILKEYYKARELLGNVAIQQAESLHSRQRMGTHTILEYITEDFPLVYYVAIAIFYPARVNLSTIAVLQQASSRVQSTFRNLCWNFASVGRQASNVRGMYDLENEENIQHDGGVDYLEHAARPDYLGMALDLRNASFSYPGSTSAAIDNVSVSIKPGQLVVIVGSNGSGKSTIIKLLTRLYDVTSGRILLDNRDLRDYRLDHLRQATASLTQEHQIFPVSLGENIMIGLGTPGGDVESSSMQILDAARKGGALGLVQKHEEGLDTKLNQRDVRELYHGLVYGNPHAQPLLDKFNTMNKNGDELSGGEKQRLIAARTFMKLNSGKVRLVVVDEPTSALDAEGERALFDNLRESRRGKTMIFVTHRFGHLTVHADAIICMKDGRVVETGTHQELLDIAGEYAKLYNIQAQAFKT